MRRKGCGGKKYDNIEKLIFPTSIIATGDMYSRYVFRADIAFDWNVSANDIERDINLYKENHLYNFARRNAKYRYSFYDKTKVNISNNTTVDDTVDLTELERRKEYLDGFHVNATYTAIAHYWLLSQVLRSTKTSFISDEDSSIITALMRVYNNEITNKTVHCFLCKLDKSQSKTEAYSNFVKAKETLKEWKELNDFKGNLTETAKLKFSEDLKYHSLYNYIEYNGKNIQLMPIILLSILSHLLMKEFVM